MSGRLSTSYKMRCWGRRCARYRQGSRTLKDAINEAVRDWVTNVATTHYLIGSAVGMHPYPTIVRDFQSVIGRESRKQCLDQLKRLPDYVVACVGGGSNSIGIFHPFIEDASVQLVGVEAAGSGIDTGKHAATLSAGSIGRSARLALLSASGRGRPGDRDPQHQRGSGLSRALAPNTAT